MAGATATHGRLAPGLRPSGSGRSTLGGAAALDRDDVGHLRSGARADLVVLEAPSAIHLAYRPGVPLVREVYVGGRRT